MNILEALETLDKSNDNHWTQGGLPRIETMRMLVGNASLSREEIDAAAPGYTRSGIVSPVVESPEQQIQGTKQMEMPEVSANAMSLEQLDEAIKEGERALADAAREVEYIKEKHEEIRRVLDDLIDARTVAQGKESSTNIHVEYLRARQLEYQRRAEQMEKVRGIDLKALVPQRSALDQAISSANVAARRQGQ